MSKSLKRSRRWATVARTTAPRYRRLACEWLEDRRMLSLGDLLQTLHHPTPADNDYSDFKARVIGGSGSPP